MTKKRGVATDRELRPIAFASRVLILVGLLCGLAAIAAQADEPKAEPKPLVKMSTPIGLATGSTTKLIVRGLLLDEASEVRVQGSPLALKILSKGKAPLPANTDPKILGDTQVEIEATAPADLAPGEVKFTLVTPKGESAPHSLLVVAKDKLVANREPNGGFRDAQPIEPGQVIEGVVEQARNVNVYRLELAGGKKLSAEVLAARYGSALDPLLSLYDSRGRLLASEDDTVGTDPRLELTIAESGTYYLVLVDALDQGGPTHPFQLITRVAE
jgi:hypothetical protein